MLPNKNEPIERSEADAHGRARGRREEKPRHRHHLDRRGVVLCDVIAIKAELFGQRNITDALVELHSQRPIIAVDVIENPELHFRVF